MGKERVREGRENGFLITVRFFLMKEPTIHFEVKMLLCGPAESATSLFIWTRQGNILKHTQGRKKAIIIVNDLLGKL